MKEFVAAIEDEQARRVFVTARATPAAICLDVDGYVNTGVDGAATLVAMEFWEGELRLLVWADKDSEEPTHTISLEGARPERYYVFYSESVDEAEGEDNSPVWMVMDRDIDDAVSWSYDALAAQRICDKLMGHRYYVVKEDDDRWVIKDRQTDHENWLQDEMGARAHCASLNGSNYFIVRKDSAWLLMDRVSRGRHDTFDGEFEARWARDRLNKEWVMSRMMDELNSIEEDE